jgi:hypothetical protein
MPQPLGYLTRADIRAQDAALIAAFLASGGIVQRFTEKGERIQ